MKEVFFLKKPQEYCSRQMSETRNVGTEHYGVDTLSFCGHKIYLFNLFLKFTLSLYYFL